MNKLKFALILAAGAALALPTTHVAAQDGPPIQFKAHPEGAEVAQLRADGPATSLGLQVGDIVLEVGGTPISPQVLQAYMSSKKEGDQVSFKVKRAGAVVDVTGKAPGGAPQVQPKA